MKTFRILTPLLAVVLLLCAAVPARAQSPADEVLLSMHQAVRKGDRAQLTRLLPQAAGHPLEA